MAFSISMNQSILGGTPSASRAAATTAATAAAAKKAAISGLSSIVSSISSLGKGNTAGKVDAKAIVGVMSKTHTEMKKIAMNSLDVLAAIYGEIRKMVAPKKSDLKKNAESSAIIVKLSDRQLKTMSKAQGERLKDLKKSQSSLKLFERIVSVVMDDKFERKANAFDKISVIIGKGFTRIGDAIATIKGTQLMLLAASIGVLGLAIWAFSEVVTAEAAIKTVLVLGAMGLAFKFLFNKDTTWGMTKFAIGLATTGLAIWAFGELVNYETLGPVILGLAGLAGALWLFNKLVSPGVGASLLVSSLGVAALGLAIHFGYKDVTLENALVAAAAVGGLGVALKLFGGSSVLGGVGLLAASLGVGVLGLSLQLYRNLTWDTLGITAAAIGGLGAAMLIFGAGAPLILLGAATLVGASAAMGIAGLAFAFVSSIKIDPTSIDQFCISTRMLGNTLFDLGGPIDTPMILMGAATLIAIGAATIAGATGIALASAMNINQDNLSSFATSIAMLGDSYKHIGGPIDTPRILLGAAAVLPMSLTTMIAAGALRLVSNLGVINNRVIDSFGYSINYLGKAYTSLGGPLKLAKMTAAVTVALGMSIATVGIASSIKSIDRMGLTETSSRNSALVVDGFVTTMSDSLDRNASKMKSMRLGITSLAGLGNMMLSMSEGIQRIGNLQFVEYEVHNGKLRIAGSRSFKKEDFERVGLGIGHIVNSLSEPLANIGSNKESFSVFGLKVTNPFGNKVKAGLKAMASLSSILNPISLLVDTFSRNGIDSKATDNFIRNLTVIIQGIGHNVTRLSKNEAIKSNLFGSFVNDAGQLMRDVSRVDPTALGEVNTGMDTLFGHLTNNDPYIKAAKNLDTLKNKLSAVRSEFNFLDIQRLNIFSDIVKNLAVANNNSHMMELIRQLGIVGEQIAQLALSVEASSQARTAGNSNPFGVPTMQPAPVQDIFVQKMQENRKDTKEDMQIVFEDLTKSLNEHLEKIAAAISRPLSVRPADEQAWRNVLK